jgi:2-polyprenyl-3-methyl-5-hydroxy-6-metoxy-1,4-benzoquinol methylase
MSQAFDILDEQGRHYSNPTAFNYSQYLYSYRYKVVRERMHGPQVLEVGVGYGDFSSWLSKESFQVTSIDGSQTNLERARSKSQSDCIEFVHCLFEEFQTATRFDDILITNSLEHVDDPVGVLEHMRQFLKPSGRIHITVPNALSIHRQLGVEMGMLKYEWSLNEHDHQVGHQRVYTKELLFEQVKRAGLIVQDYDGIIFKLLSNAQMELLNREYGQHLLEGFYELGRRHPDLSAELYLCCTRK